MLCRLSIMTFKNCVIALLFICSIGFSSCIEEPQPQAKCSIYGKIETYDGKNNGFRIIIQDIKDNTVQYIAVSNASGDFIINNIDAGVYTIDAEKDGYAWLWVVDDGVVNHQNRRIQLESGKNKNLKICMKNESYTNTSKVSLMDMYGNEIINTIHVPKYTISLAFKLFNGTGENHSWSVDNTDKCFVLDDIGLNTEYVFDSFIPQSGTIKHGESIVLIGSINQKIWNVYENHPYYTYSILRFWIPNFYEVTLDIDF